MAGSPKSPSQRRRGTLSAEDVAQANATAQHFARHPQNRWMTDVNGSAAAQGNAGWEETNATVFARVSRIHESSPGEAAAPMPNAPVGTIAAYKAPASATPSAGQSSQRTANNRKSVDRTAMMKNPVGLPSPPPSEGPVKSPSHTAVNLHGHNAPGKVPMPARRQSAPRRTASLFSNGPYPTTNPSPSLGHNQKPCAQQFSPSSAPSHINGRINAQTAAPPMQPMQQQQRPLQPAVQPSNNPLHPTLLLHQLADFEQTKLRTYQKPAAQATDEYRLAILRLAIETDDWFFIVLSQLHALQSEPGYMPDSLKRLDPRAFAWLDSILYPRSQLTPALVRYLANFPFPAATIRLPPNSIWYEGQIARVISFLLHLLQLWESFLFETRKQMSPPLVQDMVGALLCHSTVLQNVVFVYVVRNTRWMSPEFLILGLPKIEALHILDRDAFARGRRRNVPERHNAYEAFRTAFALWESHLQRVMAFNVQQERLPFGQRQMPPEFVLPYSVIAEFLHPGVCVPRELASSMPTQTAAIPAQRRQAELASEQGQLQRPHQSRGSYQPRFAPAQVPQALQVPSHPASAPALRGNATPNNTSNYVFPRENSASMAQPTQPDTARSALHQAHLRSPVLVPRDPHDPGPQLYRHVVEYSLSPKKIDKDAGIDKIPFDICPEHFNRTAKNGMPQRTGGPSSRPLTQASLTYRLRCCALPPGAFPNETAWVTADNVWPDDLFLELNGAILEPRRKLHHGRCLPIDLTEYIREGKNELMTIVLPDSNRQRTSKEYRYAIAVEIVGVISHTSIKDSIQHISVDASLAAIKQALAVANSNDDDDEVAVTSNNMIIELFDPYSHSRIFDTPVRGRACAHKDCFDLETFLALCKREASGFTTVVDCWRCPICRGDVRPRTLVVDEFLVQVREELARRNQLDTRAIAVEADGSWVPKKEELRGVRSPSLEREEQRGATAATAAAARAGGKKDVQVIELD